MSIIRSFAKQLIFISILISFNGCREKNENLFQPIVEVRYIDGRAQLYRHGEPYYILGAAGTQFLDKVAKYGGNSIRTWSTHDADRILDEAHKNGLTVTLGLEVGRPTWGEDFNYWNFWEVNKKINDLIPIIEKYKDHPALLMWGIGNEVNLFGGNKYIVYYTLNKIAKAIKKRDPNHPVMTAFHLYEKPHKYFSPKIFMPNLDILGFNAFDRIPNMNDKIYSKTGWNKAYLITEWGPTGHWESKDTEWGAPIEKSDLEKTELIKNYWKIINEDSVFSLGSYAFYWGFKHEITHTWFSLFSEEGYESQQVKFLKTAWSGKGSENQAPEIKQMTINHGKTNDNVYLYANEKYSAKVIADDSDQDTITYRWEIRPEEYKFYEIDVLQHNMKYYFLNDDLSTIEFIAPKKEGDYRLFVFVFDGKGNFSSQNIPFYVLIK